MPRALPLWVYLFIFVVLIAANILLYRVVAAPQLLEIHVLEVGKGGAVFIKSPPGVTALINAGSDASILRALGAAMPAWERTIDLVVLTENVASAAGGLPHVIDRYRIKTFVRSSSQGSYTREAALAEAIRAQPDMHQVTAQNGSRLSLGGGAYIDILSADGPLLIQISYGITVFDLTSSTSPGIYTSDGKTIESPH